MQDILEGANGNYEVDTEPFYKLTALMDEINERFQVVNLYALYPKSRYVYSELHVRDLAYEIHEIYSSKFLPLYNDPLNGRLLMAMLKSVIPMLEEIRRTCNIVIDMTQ